MPYITPEVRDKVNLFIPDLANFIVTEGVLNYVITKLLVHYSIKFGESYQTFNALVGVLECAKLELYRRLIAEYENEKCKDNGDVY